MLYLEAPIGFEPMTLELCRPLQLTTLPWCQRAMWLYEISRFCKEYFLGILSPCLWLEYMIQKIALVNLSKEPPKNDYAFRHTIEVMGRFLWVDIVYSDRFFAPVVWYPAADRAVDLMSYLRDDAIDMVWGYSGGSTANEILEYIQHDTLNRSRPVVLAGFSDMTILLALFQDDPMVSSWHMPNFRTISHEGYGSLESWSYFLELLRVPSAPRNLAFARRVYDYSAWEDLYPHHIVHHVGPLVIAPGRVRAQVCVGNVSTVDLLFGTKYELDFRDKILCLEECSDMDIRSLRRVLFAWRQRGVFDQVAWVVWWVPQVGMCSLSGSFANFWESIEDVFRGYHFPIIGNALFGHISPQMPIVAWDILTIDTYAGLYRFDRSLLVSPPAE